MNSRSSALWGRLRDREFRAQFVSSYVKRSVPWQLRALLKQRELSQEALGERSGLTQGTVSRSLSASYGNLTLNTIVRLAAGFDVAFIGKFVPFSKLVEEVDALSEEGLVVLGFEAEDAEPIWAEETEPALAEARQLSEALEHRNEAWSEADAIRQQDNGRLAPVIPFIAKQQPRYHARGVQQQEHLKQVAYVR